MNASSCSSLPNIAHGQWIPSVCGQSEIPTGTSCLPRCEDGLQLSLQQSWYCTQDGTYITALYLQCEEQSCPESCITKCLTLGWMLFALFMMMVCLLSLALFVIIFKIYRQPKSARNGTNAVGTCSTTYSDRENNGTPRSTAYTDREKNGSSRSSCKSENSDADIIDLPSSQTGTISNSNVIDLPSSQTGTISNSNVIEQYGEALRRRAGVPCMSLTINSDRWFLYSHSAIRQLTTVGSHHPATSLVEYTDRQTVDSIHSVNTDVEARHNTTQLSGIDEADAIELEPSFISGSDTLYSNIGNCGMHSSWILGSQEHDPINGRDFTRRSERNQTMSIDTNNVEQDYLSLHSQSLSTRDCITNNQRLHMPIPDFSLDDKYILVSSPCQPADLRLRGANQTCMNKETAVTNTKSGEVSKRRDSPDPRHPSLNIIQRKPNRYRFSSSAASITATNVMEESNNRGHGIPASRRPPLDVRHSRNSSSRPQPAIPQPLQEATVTQNGPNMPNICRTRDCNSTNINPPTGRSCESTSVPTSMSPVNVNTNTDRRLNANHHTLSTLPRARCSRASRHAATVSTEVNAEVNRRPGTAYARVKSPVIRNRSTLTGASKSQTGDHPNETIVQGGTSSAVAAQSKQSHRNTSSAVSAAVAAKYTRTESYDKQKSPGSRETQI